MLNASQVKMGAKISFIPEAVAVELSPAGNDGKRHRCPVSGTVVYINQAHRYCTVEYQAGDSKLRESMKFNP